MKRFFMGLTFCATAFLGVLAQSPLLVYVAHRGCHVNDIAPQNSVDAVYYAARAGYDYTEMDVRKTRDGVFVCMHASFYGNVNNRADYSPVENASKLNVELFTYEELTPNTSPSAAIPRCVRLCLHLRKCFGLVRNRASNPTYIVRL